MSNKNMFRFFLLSLFLVLVSFGSGLAADYPSKPITLIIPFSAGGAHDINARVFTSIVPQYLGQPMVVRLMPGAGGQMGTAAAVRAKPDGYTLILTHNYLDQLQPLVEKLPYDTNTDLVAVWQLNYSPFLPSVLAESPWKSMKDVLEYAKKNPGKLRFGHSGKWGATFTIGALLFSKEGIDVQFIPFKGGGPVNQAFLAGDVDFTFGFPGTLLSLYKAGKVRFLAVIGEKRLKEIPEVPTLEEELGYSFSGAVMTRVVMAPRKTPESRLQVLRQAFRKSMEDTTYKRLMGRLGENMEYMDGPDYEKLRPKQKKEYEDLVKKVVGK